MEVPLSMFGPLPDGNLDNNVMPDPADKVKYGEYLVTAAALCQLPYTDGAAGRIFQSFFRRNGV